MQGYRYGRALGPKAFGPAVGVGDSESPFCHAGDCDVSLSHVADTESLLGECLPCACPACYLCIKYPISSPKFIPT